MHMKTSGHLRQTSLERTCNTRFAVRVSTHLACSLDDSHSDSLQSQRMLAPLLSGFHTKHLALLQVCESWNVLWVLRELVPVS